MSDYLERLIGRARSRDFEGLFPESWSTPEPSEMNAVRRDAFDQMAWDEMVGQNPALREDMMQLEMDHPTSPPAYEDLFNLLNQGDPRFVDTDRMLAQYRPQHALLRGFDEAEDIEWVRAATRYDEYNTTLALTSMRDRIRDAFEQMQDLIDAAAAAEEALQQAIAAATEALASGEGEGEASEQLEQAMAAAGEGEGRMQDKADELAESMAEGVSDVKDEIERQRALAEAFGVSAGQLKRMSFNERRRLAERFDRVKIKKLADLIGSFRQYADAERRRRVRHAPAEAFDVELGSDVHRLVSSELVNLAVPELEDLFWLRYAKQGLLQWVTRGVENLGKGPIIVLCDESGSMQAQLDEHGTREAWSKAVSLALCDQARRDGRDFIYVGFASAGQQSEHVFSGGRTTPEGVVEFVEHFFNGGTDYERPLTRAMGIIEEYAGGGREMPDVVLITDGICSVSARFKAVWADVRQRHDVRCYGVQVGGAANYRDLFDITDQCIPITGLNAAPEGMKTIFRTI